MASKYILKYPIPKDFPDILHDFTKEILKAHPNNILEFSFKYFKALETGEEMSYVFNGEKIPVGKKKIQQSSHKGKIR